MGVYEGGLWVEHAIGDAIGSVIFWTKPVVYKQAVDAGRALVRKVGNATIDAKNAAIVASDLFTMAEDIAGIMAARITDRLFGGKSPSAGDASALDRVLGDASPLTIAILNIVADAVADLTPRQKGYILGLVSEQIAEVVAVTAATEGLGDVAESLAIEERVAGVLEGVEEFKNSPRLKAAVDALREAFSGGGTAEERAAIVRRAQRSGRWGGIRWRRPTPGEYEKFAFGHTPKKQPFNLPWTDGRKGVRIVDDIIRATGTIQEATTIEWSSAEVNQIGTRLYDDVSKKFAQAEADGWLLKNDPLVKEVIWYGVEPLPTSGRAGELGAF